MITQTWYEKNIASNPLGTSFGADKGMGTGITLAPSRGEPNTKVLLAVAGVGLVIAGAVGYKMVSAMASEHERLMGHRY